jgi:hypothetical protein
MMPRLAKSLTGKLSGWGLDRQIYMSMPAHMCLVMMMMMRGERGGGKEEARRQGAQRKVIVCGVETIVLMTKGIKE